MPHYEFFCYACQKAFSRILALVDYEEGEMRCPYCGSTNVEQRWSTNSGQLTLAGNRRSVVNIPER